MTGVMQQIQMDAKTLDVLMPMHLVVCGEGRIFSAGPTLKKLCKDTGILGENFHDIFDMGDDGRTLEGGTIPLDEKLHLSFKSGAQSTLKGVAAKIAGANGEGDGFFVNLSFGFSLIDAVAEHRLTASDFAPTDLAVELLYLVEAQSVVLGEAKQLNARLQGAKLAAEEQAFTDTLTGLKNRRALDCVLSRMKTNFMPFALLHLDLDFFKSVNDTHGHAAGDRVLQRVAQVLSEDTREEDLVARVGGDEFILVFCGAFDEAHLMKTALRIINHLEQPVSVGETVCHISGSVGITATEFYDVIDETRMLHDADTALYVSKRNGRGCVTVFSPLIHGIS
jgi:diguanylate cyclase (GGDEF)-like protein